MPDLRCTETVNYERNCHPLSPPEKNCHPSPLQKETTTPLPSRKKLPSPLPSRKKLPPPPSPPERPILHCRSGTWKKLLTCHKKRVNLLNIIVLYQVPVPVLEMKIWISWSESNSWTHFYKVLYKNWKIYWCEQSFSGIGPEDRCSS